MKNDVLSDGQSSDARDCAIDPRVVVVGANACLHHLGRKSPAVRIDVHHRAAQVAHRDGHRGCIVGIANVSTPPTH